MKLAPYVSKLNDSQEYQQFIKENKDAFMIAGFFVLDFEAGGNIHQIDFYIPSKNKVAAFTLDNKVILQELSFPSRKKPEQLDIRTNVDLDALKGILEEEMKNRNITDGIKKIIAVIQVLEGKKIWVINGLLSGMGLLKATIEDDSRTILKMEKLSLLDYMRQIPAEQLVKMQGALSKEEATENEGEVKVVEGNISQGGNVEKEEINSQLENLNKIEKELQKLEKEKAEFEKREKAKGVGMNAAAKSSKIKNSVTKIQKKSVVRVKKK